MNICALVLAAGLSSRFGADKRLATMPDGSRVIDALLDQITASGLPLLVCLRQSDTALAQHLEGRNIPVYRSARAQEGMGGTLADTVTQLASYDGMLVCLADMPWIKAATYKTIAEQITPNTICIPTQDKKRGHPVGFGSAYFGELAALGGDSGARSLCYKYANRIHEIPVHDAAIHHDIDTTADLDTHCQASAEVIK